MVSYTKWEQFCTNNNVVLILIVVDNGLVHVVAPATGHPDCVLILIVVDNGLVLDRHSSHCHRTQRLNPYCSGQWSRTPRRVTYIEQIRVLILIVVDNGLVPWYCTAYYKWCNVLILIVVDNGLVPTKVEVTVTAAKRLNPYCSGQWSRTLQ